MCKPLYLHMLADFSIYVVLATYQQILFAQ